MPAGRKSDGRKYFQSLRPTTSTWIHGTQAEGRERTIADSSSRVGPTTLAFPEKKIDSEDCAADDELATNSERKGPVESTCSNHHIHKHIHELLLVLGRRQYRSPALELEVRASRIDRGESSVAGRAGGKRTPRAGRVGRPCADQASSGEIELRFQIQIATSNEDPVGQTCDVVQNARKHCTGHQQGSRRLVEEEVGIGRPRPERGAVTRCVRRPKRSGRRRSTGTGTANERRGAV
ncbi:hypothetical protein C8R45DRAFT_1008091 [Mycena sanguinolenta]|nr:hypothetical protein C8R45DRAFT_1008091 [Mycena sanguinolenta]